MRAITRVKRSLDKRAFDRIARRVLYTSPLRPRGDSPLFLSMLPRRDLIPYLLAIKSLYLRIGCGRVVVINEVSEHGDNTLVANDIAILSHHIPGIEIVDIAAIPTGSCPRGGTWERLVKAVELSGENYVIQVDADTLVFADIPEVVECWKANRSFLLGTGSGRTISPAPGIARMVRGWIEENGWTRPVIGVSAEALLDKLPRAAQKFYVHASSGFAGFARGAFQMVDLECFSNHMSELLGARWSGEWGSEQVGSNYILANAPGASVLPFPRYACFEPHLQLGDHAFLHFLGIYRYDGGVYRRRAHDFMADYDRLSAYRAAPDTTAA